jgi:ankyrin repeat protein
MENTNKEMTSQLENDPQTPLLEAENHGLFEGVKRGILEEVQEALRNGAEIDGKEQEYGETALHLAARYAHKSIIEFLLAKGADFNVRDNDEWTPLISACCGQEQQQALPVVELLLDRSKPLANDGGDHARDSALANSSTTDEPNVGPIPPPTTLYINLTSTNGSTALTKACCKSTAEIVHLLLENQADVNTQDIREDTPLILAARHGTADMVKDVLSRDPDVHKVCSSGSALHQAIQREEADDRERIVYLLLDKDLSVSVKDAEGSTPLHLASNCGYANIVKKLLDQPGLDVNAQNNSKETPLHLASENGHLDVAGQLLGCPDIRVNLQSSSDATPLFQAVQNNHPEVVQKLLNHADIDPNVRSLVGMTPLHPACALGYLEMVEGLLNSPKIEVNAMDSVGRNPLIRAIERNRPPIVKRLLDHAKIDLGGAGFRERTPLHRASMKGSLEIVMMITDKMKTIITDKMRTDKMIADKMMTDKMITDKIEEQINSQDETGLTALHLACQNGHMAVVRQLLSLGAKTRVGKSNAQSAWYCFVEYLFKSWDKTEPETQYGLNENSGSKDKPALPATDEIKLILARADEEEKESATIWADNKDKRTFLADVMGIKVSKLINYQLLRLAKSSDRPETAKDMVKLSEVETSNKPRPSSALQWAAFHGRHEVVWWLLKNSTPDNGSHDKAKEDREQAKAIAKSRLGQLPPQKEAHGAKSGIKEGDMEETQVLRTGLTLTVAILKSPPSYSGYNNRPIEYDTSLEEVLRAHRATIVDFYQRDGQFDLLSRSGSVFDVIYADANPNDDDKGPETMMSKARANLEEESKGHTYERKNLRMRWIHLPANIVSTKCHKESTKY